MNSTKMMRPFLFFIFSWCTAGIESAQARTYSCAQEIDVMLSLPKLKSLKEILALGKSQKLEDKRKFSELYSKNGNFTVIGYDLHQPELRHYVITELEKFNQSPNETLKNLNSPFYNVGKVLALPTLAITENDDRTSTVVNITGFQLNSVSKNLKSWEQLKNSKYLNFSLDQYCQLTGFSMNGANISAKTCKKIHSYDQTSFSKNKVMDIVRTDIAAENPKKSPGEVNEYFNVAFEQCSGSAIIYSLIAKNQGPKPKSEGNKPLKAESNQTSLKATDKAADKAADVD